MVYADRTEHGCFFRWHADERYWESESARKVRVIPPPENEAEPWRIVILDIPGHKGSLLMSGNEPVERELLAQTAFFLAAKYVRLKT